MLKHPNLPSPVDPVQCSSCKDCRICSCRSQQMLKRCVEIWNILWLPFLTAALAQEAKLEHLKLIIIWNQYEHFCQSPLFLMILVCLHPTAVKTLCRCHPAHVKYEFPMIIRRCLWRKLSWMLCGLEPQSCMFPHSSHLLSHLLLWQIGLNKCLQIGLGCQATVSPTPF